MSTTETKGTALVTGASGGIGGVYADRLAKRGYDLILVARNEDRLTALARGLENETGRSVGRIVADLSDKADLARIETTLRTNAKIALLVNNAGVGATASLLDSDVEKMDQMIRLNVGALTRLTYAAAPGFVARGGGTIINIASSVAISPETLNGVYGGTKAFVLAFSLSLDHELAGMGVRVHAVLPGATATAFWGTAGLPVSTAHGNRDVGGRLGRCRPRRSRPGRDRHHSIASGQGRVGSVRCSAPRDVRQALGHRSRPPIQHPASPIRRRVT